MTNIEHKKYQKRGLNDYRLNAILKYSHQKVIDVGCGSGAYVLHLRNKFNISGIDYEYFESWKQYKELFQVGSIDSLPFDNNQFETTLLFEVLEHINNPILALKELHRVTSKNLIITVPNCELTLGMKKSGLIYNHWIDRTHINFYDKKEFIEIITKSGFKLRHFEYINYINLGWLFCESLKFNDKLSKVFSLLINKVQKKYPMSMLIVADKI